MAGKKTLLDCLLFLSLLRLGDRGNEFSLAPLFNDFLSRLSLFIQFPMPDRIVVRIVEDGVFEELIAHEFLYGLPGYRPN